LPDGPHEKGIFLLGGKAHPRLGDARLAAIRHQLLVIVIGIPSHGVVSRESATQPVASISVGVTLHLVAELPHHTRYGTVLQAKSCVGSRTKEREGRVTGRTLVVNRRPRYELAHGDHPRPIKLMRN
jgi:hypothetical protein